MKTTQPSQLFTDLSVEESATVQGGRCHYRSYYRPSYYYYQPRRYLSYSPSYSYGYGYGGVNQAVSINVRIDD